MAALWQKSPVNGNRFVAVISFPPSFSRDNSRASSFVANPSELQLVADFPHFAVAFFYPALRSSSVQY
jgi:hypothetical protein